MNIQNDKGKVKPCQVRQVIRVIEKLEGDEVNDHYTYRVTWSAENDEHVGLCVEFPSLSWLAPTPAKALAGIERLVRNCLEDMRATGETPPVPVAERVYSGKFMVRVPTEIHRALALRAAEEGISLNRLVSARLANA